MHVDLQYNNQFQVSRVSSKRLQSLAIDVLMNNCTFEQHQALEALKIEEITSEYICVCLLQFPC